MIIAEIANKSILAVRKWVYDNLILFVIPLLISLLVWLNPEFFSKETFINYGDMAFPLNPALYLKDALYLWLERNEIGTQSIFSPFLIPASLVYLFAELIRIPLWIVNRIWVILPLASLGWGMIYFYNSVAENSRNKKIASIIAAVFVMLYPVSEIYPYQYFSLCGFCLLFGILLRIKRNFQEGWKYYFLSLISILLLWLTPRYLYLACLTMIAYYVLDTAYEKRIDAASLKRLSKLAVFTLLSTFFILLPLLQFFFEYRNTIITEFYNVRSPHEYQTGLSLWFDYKDWVSPLFCLRGLIENPFAPVTPLILKPIFVFFSFLIPFLVFLPMLFKKSKINMILYLILVLFLSLSVAPYSILGRWAFPYIFKHIPGFFIFKSPVFFVIFLGVFFAFFSGTCFQLLLDKIDQRVIPPVRKNRLKFASILCMSLFLFLIHGNALLIGISPKKSMAGWGNVIYANHTPAMKIPAEYYALAKFLDTQVDKGNRVLNLPWTHGGYVPYRWWKYYDVPEIMNFITPIPVLGASFPPSGSVLNDLEREIKVNNWPKAVALMDGLQIKFIMVHKDYYNISEYFNPYSDQQIYMNHLRSVPDEFKVIMENDDFIVFERKNIDFDEVFVVNNAMEVLR